MVQPLVCLANFYSLPYKSWASLVVQTAKHLPIMWEIWVRSLSREDPLEKGMAIHSSILAWRTPWTEEPGRLQSMGSQRIWHDYTTNTLNLSSNIFSTVMFFYITLNIDFSKNFFSFPLRNTSWYTERAPLLIYWMNKWMLNESIDFFHFVSL